jgi:hypothetical protein
MTKPVLSSPSTLETKLLSATLINFYVNLAVLLALILLALLILVVKVKLQDVHILLDRSYSHLVGQNRGLRTQVERYLYEIVARFSHQRNFTASTPEKSTV